MKTIYKKLSLVLLLLTIISTQISFSQVLISNSTGTPDNSAMLEIRSNDKGMLIPRLTTAQRTSLSSTAVPGLLVYDTDFGSFFIWGKNSKGSSSWINLSISAGIWETNNSNVFLSNSYSNVGIGTSTPTKKLVIQADNNTDTLMEILDKDGKPLMILTPTLTKFYFNKSAKGIAGGFAVGRYATAKAISDTALFIVTPDSTRVYTSGLASTVEAGGFAVGRYATAKGTSPIKFFNTNIHNTRVYTDGDAKKGIAGGFAVGRYATAKGENAHKYFYADIDSTRIYTDGSGTKGIAGGFAVGRYATAKAGGTDNYMYMIPDNYFIGHQSGDSLQNSTYTGKYNTFFGYKTGLKDTSGSRNVLLGYEAGLNNFIGNDNVSIGYQAGREASIATNNINIGTLAGFNNDSASNNIFIGNRAGFNHVESPSIYKADNNIFMGNQAGYGGSPSGLDSSYNNVFIGNQSGFSIESGSNNVFLGNQAGMAATTANQNVFLGNNAGIANSTGEANVFIGDYAGQANTIGNYNVLIGRQAGDSLIDGFSNVFIGDFVGYDIKHGEKNTYIGADAGGHAKGGNQNIFMGAEAGLYHKIGDDNVYLGNLAGAGDASFTTITGNKRNVILGANAGTFMNGAIDNIFIGHKAGEGSTAGPVTGDYNVIVGEQAGNHLTSGNRNVFIGNEAGNNTHDGQKNIFMGYRSGFNNTVGENNIFLGNEAGFYNSGVGLYKGENNIYIGNSSGHENIDGAGNVFIGQQAGKVNKGSSNVLIGQYALQNDTAGEMNVIIGAQAALSKNRGNSNTIIGNAAGNHTEDGEFNVFIGKSAGNNYNGSDGSNLLNNNVAIGFASGFWGIGTNNVLIGTQSGYNLTPTTSTGNVFIGYKSGYNENGSNKLYIDNSSTASPLIYGDFSTNILNINGTLTFNSGSNSVTLPSTRGTSGYVLKTNADGTTAWTSIASASDATTASNGLTETSDDIQLGGTLTKNTTITQGDYGMIYNLTGTGDFEVKENGATAFYIGNNGNVGIGAVSLANSELYANRSSANYGAGKSTIYGYRAGTSGSSNGGANWGLSGVDAAIKGYTYFGNGFSAGIAGYSDLDYNNSASIIGSKSNGTKSGMLAYKDNKGKIWAGYFDGDIKAKGVSMNIQSTSSSLTITDDDGIYTLLAANTITITLPTAADNEGRIIIIQKNSGNTSTVTIDGEGAELINGSATVSLTNMYTSYTLQSDGSRWRIIGQIQ